MSNEAEGTVGVRGVRTLTGRVVSNKMDKTIAVVIERLVRQVPAPLDQAAGAR